MLHFMYAMLVAHFMFDVLQCMFKVDAGIAARAFSKWSAASRHWPSRYSDKPAISWMRCTPSHSRVIGMMMRFAS